MNKLQRISESVWSETCHEFAGADILITSGVHVFHGREMLQVYEGFLIAQLI